MPNGARFGRWASNADISSAEVWRLPSVGQTLFDIFSASYIGYGPIGGVYQSLGYVTDGGDPNAVSLPGKTLTLSSGGVDGLALEIAGGEPLSTFTSGTVTSRLYVVSNMPSGCHVTYYVDTNEGSQHGRLHLVAAGNLNELSNYIGTNSTDLTRGSTTYSRTFSSQFLHRNQMALDINTGGDFSDVEAQVSTTGPAQWATFKTASGLSSAPAISYTVTSGLTTIDWDGPPAVSPGGPNDPIYNYRSWLDDMLPGDEATLT